MKEHPSGTAPARAYLFVRKAEPRGTDSEVKSMTAKALTRWCAVGVVTMGLAVAVPLATLAADDAKDIQKNEQRLQTNAKQLDADAARAATTADGQRRLDERLAKQFDVDSSVVTGLRDRHFSYGQATITLALSQQLMKQDPTLTQQAALDKIVAERRAGKGWGVIAHDMKLKLGDVMSAVKKADKAADHVAGKPDKVDQNVAKIDKPDKPDKVDKPDKPERPARPEKPGR